MKVILIGGASGSGKTYLSGKIMEKYKNGFVLSTDNYYKTGLASKILKKIIKNYFDKKISFNSKQFKQDFNYICNNRESRHQFSYDFINKTIEKSFNRQTNIEFLIVEGIFAKDLISYSKKYNYFFIELKVSKKSCMNRVISRDVSQRGKTKENAKRDFLQSWAIYYGRNKSQSSRNDLNKFICSKNTDIDLVIQKIFN